MMKEEKEFDIKEVMEQMKKENKRIFCSEADFQFTLAWTIKEKYQKEIKKIFLEYPFEDNNIKENKEHKHLDILIVFKNGNCIPIELKYKTTYPKAYNKKGGKIYKDNEFAIKFKVKDQQAKNYGCYNYIKDIKRIELFKKKNNNFKEGYAIMLTNDERYSKKIKNYDENKYDYSKFSIHEGRKGISGELNWKNPKSKYPSIKLTGKYDIEWDHYQKVDDFGEFKYLITKIT